MKAKEDERRKQNKEYRMQNVERRMAKGDTIPNRVPFRRLKSAKAQEPDSRYWMMSLEVVVEVSVSSLSR